MAEFIDPVFAKTTPKRSFSLIENERVGLVFAKTGSINSGTVLSCLQLSFGPANLTESSLKITGNAIRLNICFKGTRTV